MHWDTTMTLYPHHRLRKQSEDHSSVPKRLHRHALGRLTAVAMVFMTTPLCAATCTLGIQGVSFGNYDFLSSQNLDGVGNVSVTCDVSTSYTIALSPGTGTYALRLLSNGSYQLTYNLYTDAAHTTVWGDGSSGSSIVSGSGTSAGYSAYGSIPAGQNPYAGSYSDAITVTLTF